ncbi:unnamed protein product [Didymodactylos carnosus]|uniref:Nudix hydrolase domain-containing protein n=1 Tax=Didymodactylos carnosus TaxID=1234261 RepID=A0A815X575_9BILA|nr:unnamed protein product [Didymodactylos carnosus]CAF1553347.1 unnamed protein product [Didymodactylos carnosus]CAF4138898.1 unnamed protein product [Didymodactylos carnosus]CAF4414491.1 unnamed protein product [Didymodactylos carnosus]
MFNTRSTGAGLIIFSRNGKQVVLVESNYADYNLGFPKGFIDKYETPKQAAIREANEETGLKIQELTFVPLQQPLVEYDPQGNNEYYVAGVIDNNINQIQFRYNPYEIRSTRWYSISDALQLQKLYPNRKQLLLHARQLYLKSKYRNKLLHGHQFIHS